MYLLVRVFRGQKWLNRSNKYTSNTLGMMLDWYLTFHFWSGVRDHNLKINMAANIQDGRHMAIKYIVTSPIVCKLL